MAPEGRFCGLIVAVALAGCACVFVQDAAAAHANDEADRDAVQALREELAIARQLERLAASPVSPTSVLRHVQVLDPVKGSVTPDQSVIVSEGSIAWVGSASREPKVPGIVVVDGGNRYLSPGLVDMHVHSASASAWLLDLAAGVTSVREMAGFPWLLDVRQRVADGRMLAPTLYVAGTILNAFPYEGYFAVPTGTLDARRLVRQQAACGYNFIKIHNVLPRPIFDAIADEAARQGMDLIGHVPHDIPVRYAVEHGMRTLEHLKGFLNDATLEMGDTDYVAAANPNVWVTPTLYAGRRFDEPAALRRMLTAPEIRYVPARKRDRWAASVDAAPDQYFERARRGEGYRRQITRTLSGIPGIQFLAGTDAAGYDFTVMGFGLVEELQLLQANGLSPAVVLRAATASPAEAMRVSGEFGLVAKGQRADLVLLDRNPLESAAAFQANAGVMVRGRWLARATIDSALVELTALYAKPAPAAVVTAAGAQSLAADARGFVDRGFVFSPGILEAAAAALQRAGHTATAESIRALADAPTTGPCAVPAR